MSTISFPITLLITLFCSCLFAQKSDFSKELKQLSKTLTGDYNTKVQSTRDSGYVTQTLHITPIWKDDKDNFWLYVEQAVFTAQHAPHRQRIYKLEATDANNFKCLVYTIKDERFYAGGYKKASKFDELQQKHTTMQEGCTIFLTRQADGTYTGGTKENNCMSTRGKTKYITTEITAGKDKITIWDKGFSEDGKQVMGLTKGGNEFVKE